MIDPLMAFAALKTASSTISSAVKAGKDLASLVGPITRLAKAEADLSFAAEKKALEAEAHRKRRLKNMIILTLSLVTAITILTLEIMYLKGAL